MVGAGTAASFPNLGDLQFGPAAAIVFVTQAPFPRFQTLALGDVDGDGDVDLLLPVVGSVYPDFDDGPAEAGADLLVRNRGEGLFDVVDFLVPDETPGHAQVATFTDRDRDGDLDLLVPSEFGDISEPTAFFRNDSGGDWPTWVNDAPELGADIRPSAMGIDSADLNNDGRIDYCVSSFGPMMCLLSHGEVGYAEGAAALGIEAPEAVAATLYDWSAYSLELADFDNDSWADLAVVAGPPNRAGQLAFQPDVLFQGLPDGTFREATDEVDGFSDPRRHYGAAAADLDGDGSLDLVVGGTEGLPRLWMNRCGAEAWVEIEPVGAGLDPLALGTWVEVEAGGRRQLRELHGPRALGQGPSRLHFGLGEAERVDRLMVGWPDGSVTEATDLPVRGRLRVEQ